MDRLFLHLRRAYFYFREYLPIVIGSHFGFTNI
jgi:hypothetical protein